ncbi:hypothetical protein [Lachnotalea sp. AF33-28]|nr:hypothetical protein [Lachnotalea sp. AF33-28]
MNKNSTYPEVLFTESPKRWDQGSSQGVEWTYEGRENDAGAFSNT